MINWDMKLQKYERYLPTAFDESLTILEKINKTIEMLSLVVDEFNNLEQDTNSTIDTQKLSIDEVKKDLADFKLAVDNEMIPDNLYTVITDMKNKGELEGFINTGKLDNFKVSTHLPIKTIQKLNQNQGVVGVCFGDSLTWGAEGGAPTTTQVGTPYPAHLQSWMRFIYDNTNVTVYNKGFPGYRADQLAPILSEQVLSLNPDFVIIMAGANESIQSTGYEGIVTFKNSMIQMIEDSLKNNIEVLLMTTHLMNLTAGNDVTRVCNNIVRGLATKYNVTLVDWEEELSKAFDHKWYDPSYLLTSDGVHLVNSVAYKFMSDTVLAKGFNIPQLNIKNGDLIQLAENLNTINDFTLIDNPSKRITNKTLKITALGGVQSGTKLGFYIYNDSDSKAKWYLLANKLTTGAKITYRINGGTVAQVNFYNTNDVYDAEIPITLQPFLNYVEFNVNDTVVGDGMGYDIHLSGIGRKNTRIEVPTPIGLMNKWVGANGPIYYTKSASGELVFNDGYLSAYQGGDKSEGVVLFILEKNERPKVSRTYSVPNEDGGTSTLTIGSDGTAKLTGFSGVTGNWIELVDVRLFID